MEETRIQVLIADDHPIILEGLRRHLDRVSDLHLIGTANSFDQLVTCLDGGEVPDVVVMDVQMPGVKGRKSVQELVARGARVVLFTLRGFDPLVANLAAGGARGYLSKTSSIDELERVIRAVHAGELTLPPELQALMETVAVAPHEQLTKREYEVFEHLISCHAPKEIAYDIGVSLSTIYTHVERVRKKLALSNVNEVGRYAREWGLVD